MGEKINVDFRKSSQGLPPEKRILYTAEQLEQEFHMPGFAKAYSEGTQTRFIPETEEGTQIVLTLAPYVLPVPEPLSRFIGDTEKGFRLFIDVKEGEDEPYRHVLFFEERAEGMMTQNGVLYARKDDGDLKLPKMTDVTVKAVLSRLCSYKPTLPDFAQNNGPQI